MKGSACRGTGRFEQKRQARAVRNALASRMEEMEFVRGIASETLPGGDLIYQSLLNLGTEKQLPVKNGNKYEMVDQLQYLRSQDVAERSGSKAFAAGRMLGQVWNLASMIYGFKGSPKGVWPIGTIIDEKGKYSLQGTTQGRYLTGGVPPVRFSM